MVVHDDHAHHYSEAEHSYVPALKSMYTLCSVCAMWECAFVRVCVCEGGMCESGIGEGVHM